MMMKQTIREGDGEIEKMSPSQIDYEIQKAKWVNMKNRKHWGPYDKMMEFANYKSLQSVSFLTMKYTVI